MTCAPNMSPNATFTPRPTADLDAIYARQFAPQPVLRYRTDDVSGPVWMTNKRWARRVLRTCVYAFAVACVVALVCGIVVALGGNS